MIKAFYTSSLLFELLTIFGELNEEVCLFIKLELLNGLNLLTKPDADKEM